MGLIAQGDTNPIPIPTFPLKGKEQIQHGNLHISLSCTHRCVKAIRRSIKFPVSNLLAPWPLLGGATADARLRRQLASLLFKPRKRIPMSETASAPPNAAPAQRREFRNLNLFDDILGYRMPLAGWVSILHRVSGALLFVMLPFIIWLLDVSVSSPISFGRLAALYTEGIGFIPAWFIKLVTLGLIWAYLHHFCAGLRYLWMDATHTMTKSFGRSSAIAVFIVSLLLTVILGLKLLVV
jgi:succinate dehydrogenase / fumarate reductase cytochrome b subunit